MFDAHSNLGPGDHVLLLPTAAPYFEQAIMDLGRHFGFCVTQAPRDIVKVQRLVDALDGPITVIAGAQNPLIPDLWLALSQGSRLILSEVSVEDLSLDMRPFARGVTLQISDVSEAFNINQARLQRTLQASTDIIQKLTPPLGHSISLENLSDLSNARRIMIETGSTVLGFKPGKDQIKVSICVRDEECLLTGTTVAYNY
jgi:hypothetical protein